MRLRPLLAGGLAALASLAAPAAFAQSEPVIGSVQEVTVYAYGTPAAQARRPLFVATPVHAQERVETVTNGGLALLFDDNTQFRVGADSVVTLDSFVYAPNASTGQLALSLTKGSFRYVSGKVSKPGVQLKTPTALIGIRGTDFFVSILGAGGTLIGVVSGIVSVQAAVGGATVEVGPGQSVTVGTNGAIAGFNTLSPPSDDALDPGANPAVEGLPAAPGESSSSSQSSS